MKTILFKSIFLIPGDAQPDLDAITIALMDAIYEYKLKRQSILDYVLAGMPPNTSGVAIATRVEQVQKKLNAIKSITNLEVVEVKDEPDEPTEIQKAR
jgi:hypothetical protein